MKKIFSIFTILLVFTLTIQSDVIKKSRSEVSFAKYGTFKTERTETTSPLIKRTDSNDNFKGKGFLSKLAAKGFFKSGEFSQIVDLKESTIARINHKKKKIVVKDIVRLTGDDGSEIEEGDSEESEERDSDITITKNEFKVIVTGKKKVINGFPTIEYSISWIVEWENNQDELKGSSRLNSNVWVTPVMGKINSSQKIESVFFKNYMKKLGLDTDMKRDDVLGGSWLRIFTSLSRSSSTQSSEKAKKFRKEISKIKGYPIVIDGEYYSATTGKKKPKGLKGLLKKKKKEGADDIPKFTFYTEILELSLTKSDPDNFSYPEGYKIK